MISYDSDNIFARLIRKEIPSKRITEDDYHMAFYDLYPKAPIHILIVPKGPYVDAEHFHKEAASEEIVGFYRAVSHLPQVLSLKNGYRLISNIGIDGEQEVPHYHLHLLAGKKLGPILITTL